MNLPKITAVALGTSLLTISLACGFSGVVDSQPETPDPDGLTLSEPIESMQPADSKEPGPPLEPIEPTEEAAAWGAQVTFTDAVNLRKSPSTTADLVATVPVGAAVRPLALGKPLTLFGLERPWVHVDTPQGRGWMWSGLLSGATYQVGDTTLVVGLRGATTLEGWQLVSVEIGGSVGGVPLVAKHADLRVPDDWVAQRPEEMFHITVSEKPGYPGIDRVVTLGFSADFCGGRSGSMVFVQQGNELEFMRENGSGFDAPMFYTEDLIFPAHEGGKPGRIVLEIRGGYYDDDDANTKVLETNEDSDWVWKNGKLVAI